MINLNKKIVKEYIQQEIPQIGIGSLDVTYLLWLDCSALTDNAERLSAYLRKKAGLYLSEGNIFGGNGAQFLRLNTATGRKNILEGLKRLKQGVESWCMED